MNRLGRLSVLAFVVCGATVLGSHDAVAQVRATVVVQELESPTGTTEVVTRFYNPVTNSLGHVSVLGTLGNGSRFIFVKDAVVFVASDVTSNALTSGDNNRSGVNDAGGWAYAPNVDSNRGIWTDKGLFLIRNDPAPNYPSSPRTCAP